MNRPKADYQAKGRLPEKKKGRELYVNLAPKKIKINLKFLFLKLHLKIILQIILGDISISIVCVSVFIDINSIVLFFFY